MVKGDFSKPTTHSGYIAADQMIPTVELANYWYVGEDGDRWWTFRQLQPQFRLIEAGRAEFRTPFGTFAAPPGSLVCLRPSSGLSVQGMRRLTRAYSLVVRFASPPNAHLVPWLDDIGPLPLQVPLGDAFERVRRLFDTICIELPRCSMTDQFRVRGAIYELLAIVQEVTSSARGRDGKTPSGAGVDVGIMDAWVRTRKRLESHLDQPLRVQELARELGVSVEHFIRRFRQRFGMSPAACRTGAKMRHALLRLREGEGSVKAVAYGLGFADPDAFTRLFKRHFGIAPSRLFARGTGDAGINASMTPMPVTAERFYPANVQILARDVTSPEVYDRLTESVTRRPPPCDPEDYLHRRSTSPR